MLHPTRRRSSRFVLLWSTWLLALASVLTVSCNADRLTDGLSDSLFGDSEYESPRKRPTVPLKRAGRWANVRCFETFSSFKRAMAAEGHSNIGDEKSWHHIVGQHAENKMKVGEHDLHCTDNVVYIDDEAHWRLNSHYSIAREKWGGKSLRDFLRPLSFDEQYTWGIRALDELEVVYVFIR